MENNGRLRWRSEGRCDKADDERRNRDPRPDRAARAVSSSARTPQRGTCCRSTVTHQPYSVTIPRKRLFSRNRKLLAMSIQVDEVENKRKMARGELYHAFTPELTAARARCQAACKRYTNAGEVPRRRLVKLWRE